MHKLIRHCATTLGLVALLGPTAQAQAVVLYDKPLDLSVRAAGFASESGSSQVAENFSLPNAATGTQITFWGWHTQANTPTYAFDILFFDDVGGLPATAHLYLHNSGPVTGTVIGTDLPSVLFGTVDVYEWTVSLPAVQFLTAGDYWVSIRGTSATSTTFTWEHATPTGDNIFVYRNGNALPWSTISMTDGRDEQAFRLEGTFSAVPEPSVLALMLLGLGSFGVRHRNRVA